MSRWRPWASPTVTDEVLADTNFTTVTGLEGTTQRWLFSLEVINTSTVNTLEMRFGTGTIIIIPPTADGNGAYEVPIPPNGCIPIVSTATRLQVRAQVASITAKVVYVEAD